MRSLKAGYLYDNELKDELNAGGLNYWWSYIIEILDRVGIAADRIPVADFIGSLCDYSIIFMGGTRKSISETDVPLINEWIKSGGILISSGINCPDDLFGNTFVEYIPQKDAFAISSEVYLIDSKYTSNDDSKLTTDNPLFTVSDIRVVDSVSSEVIAKIGNNAVITARQIGNGYAFYFGFDIAQTFWVIQQGRPITKDFDGDGYLRTPDAAVIIDVEPSVAYTDELAQLLQNMISMQPFPMIDQLPPVDGSIPDIVLFYGGDDEGDSDYQLNAARFMNSRHLPYHINCMAINGKFGLRKEEIPMLHDLGTETSLHYNFLDGFDHPNDYSEKDVQLQAERYLEYFGESPVCVVPHFCLWTKWYEPAEWMMKAGAKSTNTHINIVSSSMNPVNTIGFAFGTSYPHHYWMDASRSNEKLDMLCLPVIAYEVGYDGKDRVDETNLNLAIDLALKYRSIMNFFYHPVYISEYPSCRDAIDKLISILENRRLCVIHSTPDMVTKWWYDRNKTIISDIVIEDGEMSFKASTPSSNGFLVRLPAESIDLSEIDYPNKIVELGGKTWIVITIPKGENIITIKLK